MKVTTRLDYPAVPVGEKFTVRLMIGLLEDHKYSTVKRRPINLSLAIDRSGSMAGDKLKYSLETVRMIAGMMEQQDTFSLVAFNDKVETIIPSTKGADLKGIDVFLNKITPCGESGGYEEALHKMSSVRMDFGSSRIVLISDGNAIKNEIGKYDFCCVVDLLRRKGLTTTTFSVGKDFDEELMTDIAESGGGNAYFIETPIQAAEEFLEELDMLRSLAATNCSVRFIPSMQTIGVKQLNIFDSVDNTWYLGDLSVDEQKHLVLELSLPAFQKSGVNITLGEIIVSGQPTGPESNGEYLQYEQRFPINISILEADQFRTIRPDTGVMLEAALLSAARAKFEARSYIYFYEDFEDFDSDVNAAATLMEGMANDLEGLDLVDYLLDAEIHNLYNRAYRLRRALLGSVAVLLKVDRIAGVGTIPVTVYVDQGPVVCDFLKEVFKHFKKVVPAHTYGTRWCIRELGSGRVFDVGSPWARANGFRKDRRTLAEAGIIAGQHLEALLLPAFNMQEGGEVVESNRVVINASRLVGESASIQYTYQPGAPACDFLALVYSRIAGHVPANTYGKLWLLRDMSSGRIIDTGSAWAQSIGCQTDIRPLKNIGINGGALLQVVPLPAIRQ